MLIQLFIECKTLHHIFICELVFYISCLFFNNCVDFFCFFGAKILNTTDNTLPHQNRWCANVLKIVLKCKFGNKFNNWSETKFKASYIRIISINSCVSNIQRIITFLDISFQRTHFHKIIIQTCMKLLHPNTKCIISNWCETFFRMYQNGSLALFFLSKAVTNNIHYKQKRLKKY